MMEMSVDCYRLYMIDRSLKPVLYHYMDIPYENKLPNGENPHEIECLYNEEII